MQPLSALILAGRRGDDDSLAASHGASHRALLPVAGVPSLLRVVRTLRASARIGDLHVSIDEPARISEVPELAALLDAQQLTLHQSAASPSQSVASVLGNGSTPFLVTTADHALLDASILNFFLDAMNASKSDLLVGLVPRTLLETGYPETTRTYFHFRRGSWSGANLFGCRTQRAREAVNFWKRVEQHRKRPWRMISAIGVDLAVLYITRWIDIDDAFTRVSKKIGASIEKVAIPVAEAAIDVDRESDLELATRILNEREAIADESLPRQSRGD